MQQFLSPSNTQILDLNIDYTLPSQQNRSKNKLYRQTPKVSNDPIKPTTHTQNSMNNPILNNKITKTHIHLTSHKTHTIRLQQNNKNPSSKTPNKTNKKIKKKKKCYKVQTTSRSKLDKLNKNKRERGIGRGTSCTIWT